MNVKKDTVITWLVVGGVAYGLYYYLTHYGPSGAVMDANGNKIAPSYWDSWFGGTTAAAGATSPSAMSTQPAPASAPPASTTPTNLPSVYRTNPTRNLALPAAGNAVSTLTATLLAASKMSPTQTLNADQWMYYYQQTPGKTITAAQADSMFFPNGRPASPAQYQQYNAEQAAKILVAGGLSGLGNIIPVGNTIGGGAGFGRHFGGGFSSGGKFRSTPSKGSVN